MTVQITEKEFYINLLRANDFNPFPIPQWPKDEKEPKRADARFQGENTKLNQVIKENENYGVTPIKGKGTCIVDFDHKEEFRPFMMYLKSLGYLIIESPHGWHLYVKGLTGKIQKVLLYNYAIQKDKQIIEIQSPKQYVIGIGCKIWDKKTRELVGYNNIGSNKIFDAKGVNFNDFIDHICKKCNVSEKKVDRYTTKNQRDRFRQDKIPTKGTSNSYFFQSALVCKKEELSKPEAKTRIEKIFNQWVKSPQFSGRPWSNIERKIDEVYDKDLKLKEGRPKGTTSGIDRTAIAQESVLNRRLFSDISTKIIYEDVNGFLEPINEKFARELQKKYPQMESHDFHQILFKVMNLANEIPDTNSDLIVFKNGKFSKKAKTIIQTEELADIGFKFFNHLKKTKENEPKRFKKIIFENTPLEEHPRIKAGLKSIFSPNVDPRISVIHGRSGVGKSTGLLILHRILGDYSAVFELDQLEDKFIRAKIKGKYLVILQDLPQRYKDFTSIKTLTGEQDKTERGFQQDAMTFRNKIKIFASCNYLAKIPEHEKNPMYSRRLSLIHNTKNESYPEDSNLIDEIVNEEAEKIVSWILNLSDNECKYEDARTVRKEWEQLASPEIDYLEKKYEISDNDTVSISVMKIVRDYNQTADQQTDLKTMTQILLSQGYMIKLNVIQNIKNIDKKGNETL